MCDDIIKAVSSPIDSVETIARQQLLPGRISVTKNTSVQRVACLVLAFLPVTKKIF